MGNNLLPKLEAFIVLIASLLEDITLPKHERLEHLKLHQFLENFTLVAKGVTTSEESPLNLARSLFVQIYRMSLSRGRRAIFLERADAIEREASQIPYTAALCLDKDELQAISDPVQPEMFTRYRYGLQDEDKYLESAYKKLKHLIHKLNDS